MSSERRLIDARSLALPSGGGDGSYGKVRIHDLDKIQYGGDDCVIDLCGVGQLVEVGQTRAIAEAMQYLASCPAALTTPGAHANTRTHLKMLVELLADTIERRGLDGLERGGHAALGNLARPRLFELAAAINRWRRLRAAMG